MKYMEQDGHCGPVAILNAVRCYGEKISESKIVKACGTDKNGTTEVQMLQGLRKIGYKSEVFYSPKRIDALDFIRSRLESDRVPIILAVDNHSHYVTLIGKIGSTYTVIDPAAWNYVTEENGVISMSERELMNRWGGCKSHSAHVDKYSAIAIWNK